MVDNGLSGEPEAVVALVADLMFAARVRGAAPEAALVRRGEDLGAAVGGSTRLVLVDLQAPGALGAIGAVRAARPDVRVVAFGPHVLEDELTAAAGAGAEVRTRNAFVRELPDLVASARRKTEEGGS